MPKASSRQIIGLIGPKGSGKGTIAQYLAKHYGATVLTISDILNLSLNQLSIPITRVNQIGLALALRKTFGPLVLSHALAGLIANIPGNNPIIIDGLRMPGDWETWRSKRNAALIAVHADPDIRFARIRKRGKNPEEKRLTWQKFLAEERLPTERAIAGVSKTADYTITTNGDIATVLRDVDAIAKKLRLIKR